MRFVFDHHDLNPELFLSRFGRPTGLLEKLEYRGLRWLERRTFRTADRVISTNESYKSVAVRRGGPDRDTSPSCAADRTPSRCVRSTRSIRIPRARRPLAYLGIMGPQDGVDQVLVVMDELVHRRGRTDIRATLLGFGDCLDDLRRQATALGLDDHVIFTGRVDRDGDRRAPERCGRRAVSGPEDAAQRRLHDEQDDGVHGVRAAVGLVRPRRDPGLRRGLRALRPDRVTSRPSRTRSRRWSTTRRCAASWRSPRGKGWSKSLIGDRSRSGMSASMTNFS